MAQDYKQEARWWHEHLTDIMKRVAEDPGNKDVLAAARAAASLATAAHKYISVAELEERIADLEKLEKQADDSARADARAESGSIEKIKLVP